MIEHGLHWYLNYFEDDSGKEFIIQILSREKRSDDFVTASISTKYRKPNPICSGFNTLLITEKWLDDDAVITTHNLWLNCSISRVQLRVMLTPKFSALQRIVLVVTCAPSLENCYVFEVVTQNTMSDFGKFYGEQHEVVRRWYKCEWTDDTDSVVNNISSKLTEIVKKHIENTIKRLAGE